MRCLAQGRRGLAGARWRTARPGHRRPSASCSQHEAPPAGLCGAPYAVFLAALAGCALLQLAGAHGPVWPLAGGFPEPARLFLHAQVHQSRLRRAAVGGPGLRAAIAAALSTGGWRPAHGVPHQARGRAQVRLGRVGHPSHGRCIGGFSATVSAGICRPRPCRHGQSRRARVLSRTRFLALRPGAGSSGADPPQARTEHAASGAPALVHSLPILTSRATGTARVHQLRPSTSASASQTTMGMAAALQHRALARRWFPIVGWVGRPLTSSWAGALRGTLEARVRSWHWRLPAVASPPAYGARAIAVWARFATRRWVLCLLGDLQRCRRRDATLLPPPGLAAHAGLPPRHGGLLSVAQAGELGDQGALTSGGQPPELRGPPLAVPVSWADVAWPVAVAPGGPQRTSWARVPPPPPPGVFCLWPDQSPELPRSNTLLGAHPLVLASPEARFTSSSIPLPYESHMHRRGVLLVLATLLRNTGQSNGEGSLASVDFYGVGPQSEGYFTSGDPCTGADLLPEAAVPALVPSSCGGFLPPAVVPRPRFASLANEPPPSLSTTAFSGHSIGASAAGMGEVAAAGGVAAEGGLAVAASATGDSQGVLVAPAEPTAAFGGAGATVTQAALGTANLLGGLSDLSAGSIHACTHSHDASRGPQLGGDLQQHGASPLASDPVALVAAPGAASAVGGSGRSDMNTGSPIASVHLEGTLAGPRHGGVLRQHRTHSSAPVPAPSVASLSASFAAGGSPQLEPAVGSRASGSDASAPEHRLRSSRLCGLLECHEGALRRYDALKTGSGVGKPLGLRQFQATTALFAPRALQPFLAILLREIAPCVAAGLQVGAVCVERGVPPAPIAEATLGCVTIVPPGAAGGDGPLAPRVALLPGLRSRDAGRPGAAGTHASQWGIHLLPPPRGYLQTSADAAFMARLGFPGFGQDKQSGIQGPWEALLQGCFTVRGSSSRATSSAGLNALVAGGGGLQWRLRTGPPFDPEEVIFSWLLVMDLLTILDKRWLAYRWRHGRLRPGFECFEDLALVVLSPTREWRVTRSPRGDACRLLLHFALSRSPRRTMNLIEAEALRAGARPGRWRMPIVEVPAASSRVPLLSTWVVQALRKLAAVTRRNVDNLNTMASRSIMHSWLSAQERGLRSRDLFPLS